MNIQTEQFLEKFTEYLKLASVGTDSSFDEQTQQAAHFLIDTLSNIGFESQLIQTKGKPIVYATKVVNRTKPTILIYGHYDVQPAKKEDGWNTDPFEPTITDGFLYARGATDDKGPVLAMIHALSLFETMPVNVKLFIEGEEESGSEHFEQALVDHKDLLDCDMVLVSDGVSPTNTEPYVTIGLRGLIYSFIRINGPSQDVHSGLHGGIVSNPHQTLSYVLSQLKDHASGRVLIPHFYDDVAQPSERAIIASKSIPYSLDDLHQEIGPAPLYVKTVSELFLNRWTQPTFEIHGITGGYTGEGAKTIIPSFAQAKVSMRLVANQDPQKIYDSFVTYVSQLEPKAQITTRNVEPPQFTDPENEYMKIVTPILSKHFGKETLCVQSGGSICAIGKIDQHLQKPIISIPAGRIDDGLHSPNERVELERLYRFIRIFHEIFEKIGAKTIHS